jgi:acetylornithine deacetylase/succinyl-diaminopimelate desuccinylase-like protein
MPPAELLSRLIQFDTTNPPGAEEACQRFLLDQFAGRDLEARMLAAVRGRPNLVVRVPGRGEAPPLLLQGHADVVTTANQRWRHPPFAGEVLEGWVWGRGALDMKSGLAMMVGALLRSLDEGRPPAGDVLFCSLADEEAGGIHGAQFLVEEHRDLFNGIRHGIGEGGGATLRLGGRTFYPIMVAEKRTCRLRIVLRGPAGHAARHHRGGTTGRLGSLLVAIDGSRLPVHLTSAAEAYVRGVAEATGEPLRSRVLALLDPRRTDSILDAMGPDAGRFESVLHNTINPTVVRAGQKVNVLPSEATVDLDGRVLPGLTTEDFIGEVRAIVDREAELSVLDEGPRLPEPVMDGFFGLLCEVLRELDPEGVPVPAMMTGATDQRHFGQLGIRGYGYLPLRLPPDFGQETVHAADERVSVAALEFGVDALYQVLQRYMG